MAVKLDRLEQIAKQLNQQKDYLYKDLAFDIEVDSVYEPNKGFRVPKNDLKVSFNENAIENSIKNLLTTRPGQRFLFPKYGISFEQFLFEPINDVNAEVLGENIVRTIETFEPRVEVVRVDIKPETDLNTYIVTIVLRVIEFNSETILNSTLDLNTQTFNFIPISQR